MLIGQFLGWGCLQLLAHFNTNVSHNLFLLTNRDFCVGVDQDVRGGEKEGGIDERRKFIAKPAIGNPIRR